MSEKEITVTIANFKRGKKSAWEKGIAILINGNVQLIVDSDGKKVPVRIWDLDLYYHLGCFNTTL